MIINVCVFCIIYLALFYSVDFRTLMQLKYLNDIGFKLKKI